MHRLILGVPLDGPDMNGDLLVYGSYGFTGSLIARRAVEEGLTPVLAGRNPEPLEAQATEVGCEHRTFSLEHPTVVEDHVAGYDAVLNCAGPFTTTAEPLIEACLSAGTDYLDVAGTLDVLEAIAAVDRTAEKAGVALVPAVGFTVVPTDCLAAFLHEELPPATELTLAVDAPMELSPGTAKSAVEGLQQPGVVRTDGELRSVPAAWQTRRIDFGRGPRTTVTVPTGSLSATYYSTGIPEIETYAAVPRYAATAIRAARPLVPVLATTPVRWAIKAAVDLLVSGPSVVERASNVARVWGEVRDDEGTRVAARIRTPDPYDLTAATAVEAARRVLDDEVSAGFQTPASAFGPDFVLDFEGVEREVVGARTTPQSPQ